MKTSILLVTIACLVFTSYAQQSSIANALGSLLGGGYSQPTAYSQQSAPLSSSQITNALGNSLAGGLNQNNGYYNQQPSTSQISSAIGNSLAGGLNNNAGYYNQPNTQINNAIASSLTGSNVPIPPNSLAGAISNSISQTVVQNDRNFINFLLSNNVPNATVIPTIQQCSQYRITANGNLYQTTEINYHVTCTLPNGRAYTEPCYGSSSCDYLTCKFLKCGRLPGGKVTRVRI